MDASEAVAAQYWLSVWDWIGDKAFLIVVVALAIEFLAARWAKPHREVLDHAREVQVAQLIKDAARLSKEGDDAKAAIAEANARAVEAQLALEKFKAPRVISPEQQSKIAANLGRFTGTHFDLALNPGDPEAAYFVRQLAETLEAASWTWVEFNHPNGPFMTVAQYPDKPNMGYLVRMGVSVEVHSDHAAEFSEAAKALADTLNAEGFPTSIGVQPSSDIPNHDTMHIVVGRKFL
jgi:hypothetical protein